MGRIQVLDEQTANLIAAGEVVERPASVVKELVENALDAGASRVDIEMEEGGLRLVRVVDDGAGMDRDDARLCLERHATSKIRRGTDLFAIHTLGFRGEALPSIASVSRLEILTRPASEVAGTRVATEGGRDLRLEDAGCPVGTRITVEDLFFNTPARLKYLKSPGSETGQVSDVFTRLALSRPDVAFQLMSGGSVLSSTPGNGSLLDAVGSLYGTKLARGLTAVSWENGPTRVTGYIAKPEFARANRTHQHLFVNGRYIKGSSLRFPVEEAYRNLLMTGRFPVFFLSVEVDPEQVDVNVHPTKLDVRFSQEREVKAALYRAVQEALALTELVPSVTWGEGAPASGFAPATASPGRPPDDGGAGGAPQDPGSPWSLLAMGEAAATYLTGGGMAGLTEGEAGVGTAGAAGVGAPGAAPTVGEAVEKGAVFAPGARQGGATVHHPELLALRPLGQVLRSYIVADGPDGLYLIDQHAAHERVYFERFARERESRVTQPLLIPLELELAPQERALFEASREVLTGAGFEFADLSGGTLLVTGVPAVVGESAAPGFFRDFLDRLAGGSSDGHALDKGLEVKRAMAACKAAIKAHDPLTLAELQGLIYQLACAEHPYSCPHGRPTMISLSEGELERRFKRTGA